MATLTSADQLSTRLYRVLRERGPMSRSTLLHSAASSERDAAAKALDELLASGRVIEQPNRRYRLLAVA